MGASACWKLGALESLVIQVLWKGMSVYGLAGEPPVVVPPVPPPLDEPLELPAAELLEQAPASASSARSSICRVARLKAATLPKDGS